MKMEFNKYNRLDDSIKSFKLIKTHSEAYWKNITLDDCYGNQIQPNSRWKDGLTEKELIDFQDKMGFEFPQSLKNYYRVMNGLDRLGIDWG
jgi:hypothetical protein